MDTDTIQNHGIATEGFGTAYYASTRSLGSQFRRRRFDKLLLPLIATIRRDQPGVRILDLGGTASPDYAGRRKIL